MDYEKKYNEALERAANAFAWSKYRNNETKAASIHSFKAGAKWQKEQMMKEAVEGEIVQDVYSRELRCKTKDLRKHNFKFGDKVHLVIIKED